MFADQFLPGDFAFAVHEAKVQVHSCYVRQLLFILDIERRFCANFISAMFQQTTDLQVQSYKFCNVVMSLPVIINMIMRYDYFFAKFS